MNENSKKSSNKMLKYFYIVSILIVIYINWVLLPVLTKPTLIDSTYSHFIEGIKSESVSGVEIQKGHILYRVIDKTGNNMFYKTTYKNISDLIDDLRGKNIEVGSVTLDTSNIYFNILFSLLLPIAFITMVGKRIKEKSRISEEAQISVGVEHSSETAETLASKKTFDDVAGQDEAKESLTEIVNYLTNPEEYAEIGAKCPKGILLVGPPGTGKTLLGKAVAGEAKVPFFSVSGSEFVEMYVGRGASRVRELFQKAAKKAPCIVFIDEIDTVGKARNGGINSNEEREQTLNQLLTEMDGFAENKGVVVLAATNRPEILDPALLRPGRFDRQVRVELPDFEGRIAILKVHAKDYKMDSNIDYKLIARATAGVSGADLSNIVNEGALRAVRMGRKIVTQLDLEESIEVVIAGQQKKNDILSPEEKKIVSYHEIGHALLAALQTKSAPVHKITIIPRTSGALGFTMQVAERDKTLISKTEAMNKIATYCGGRAAEEVVFGEYTTGASNDIEQATKIARSMVTKYGMSDEFGMMALETGGDQYLGGSSQLSCSPETAKEVDKIALAIIKDAYSKALKLLKENEKKLHELANFLLEKETITGDQFMEILYQA